MDWSRCAAVRWGLRPLGAALLAIAFAAGRQLIEAERLAPGSRPPIAYLLALIAFACASAGAALLFHGHHLFDLVEVSDRWKRRPPTPAVRPMRADVGAAISRAMPLDAPHRAHARPAEADPA